VGMMDGGYIYLIILGIFILWNIYKGANTHDENGKIKRSRYIWSGIVLFLFIIVPILNMVLDTDSSIPKSSLTHKQMRDNAIREGIRSAYGVE